jgi:hypothetical protein
MAEKPKGQRTVNINGKQYKLDSLSATAKQQLQNIRVLDTKLEDTKNQIAILEAARRFYTSVLEKELG